MLTMKFTDAEAQAVAEVIVAWVLTIVRSARSIRKRYVPPATSSRLPSKVKRPSGVITKGNGLQTTGLHQPGGLYRSIMRRIDRPSLDAELPSWLGGAPLSVRVADAERIR